MYPKLTPKEKVISDARKKAYQKEYQKKYRAGIDPEIKKIYSRARRAKENIPK